MTYLIWNISFPPLLTLRIIITQLNPTSDLPSREHSLASALSFLRSHSLVHRDLKPQNILLSPPVHYTPLPPPPPSSPSHPSLPTHLLLNIPTLKLADFGFARSLENTSLASTLCGSPLYMAPEILRYEKYDAKADLWSLGMVLFECVTGGVAYR